MVRGKFELSQLSLVGDRGMITSARIEALKELGGLSWITCLRAPAIAKLAAEDGPLQLSLFDQQDLAEISHPDYPGERLIACRNPILAAERARKREALLAATEAALAPITAAVAGGRLAGADQIGLKTGKVINRYKMAKHFTLDITDTSLTITRRVDQIATEAALDGIYVLRTSVPAATLDAPATVRAYKDLAHVERDFRSIKTDDLDLRPIHHYLPDRVRAHLLICMLACYLTWHLRPALAELTYTDEQRPTRDNPVTPAPRSAGAQRKAGRHTDDTGQPLQLPGPARTHGHPDPQHHHPRPHQLRQDHHADLDSTSRIRTHRLPDPTGLEVARPQPPQVSIFPAQQQNQSLKIGKLGARVGAGGRGCPGRRAPTTVVLSGG